RSLLSGCRKSHAGTTPAHQAEPQAISGGPAHAQGTAPDPPGQGTRRAAVFWAGSVVANPADPFAGSGAEVAASAWTAAIAIHGKIPNLDIFAPASRL